MEALNGQNLPTAIKKKDCCVVKQDGKAYFSAYTDEKADKDYIRVAIKPLLMSYNVPLDTMPIYVSAILNAGMTRQRLSDAIAYTHENLEFRLTPAFLIKFDKADETRRLYYSAEMYEICQKLMCKYYDMNCSENVYQSTKIYYACRQAYFAKVGDYWCLSEVGMKRRSEVEEIERVSKYDVKCINVGRVYLQNK
jgi:hypothetical protein